jgi:hypothetical protein
MAKSEQPPVYCLRRGDSLIGEMEADREWIRQQPYSERIKVSLHTGRSPQRLKWYWAFLGKVVKATECAPTVETLHSLIKLETGFTTPVKLRGYTVLVPASVSFASMSEADFNTFCESAVRFIAETFGVTPEMAFAEEAA